MTMISSASAGMPLSPSCALTIPSFMAPPSGERRLFAMIGDGDAEGARILERRAHQLRARHRLAVVAHGHGARTDHLAELGERLAHLPDGDGADGIDARATGALGLADDEADRRLIVRDRIGVRHRADRGESAGRRGARARGDRLDILAARLAQMAVHVDEARRHDESGAVDHLDRVAVAAHVAHSAHRFHHAVDDEQIADVVQPLRGIDDPAALQENRARRHRPPPPFAASASSGFPPASR